MTETPNDGRVDVPPRVREFIDEYLVDYSATRAAIRTGYSAKTARTKGSELLNSDAGQQYLNDRLNERAAERTARKQRIIEALEQIAFFNPQSLLNVDGEIDPNFMDEAPRDVLAAIASFEIGLVGVAKVKFHDKLRALEMLGKHEGMFANRHEISGPGGGPIQTIGSHMTPQEAAEAYAATLAATA